MKIGEIARPNSKGQIVIPKAYRKALGITVDAPLHIVLRGEGIYMYPIKGVSGGVHHKEAYLKILERTQGAWGLATAEDARREQAQKRLELARTRKLKKAW